MSKNYFKILDTHYKMLQSGVMAEKTLTFIGERGIGKTQLPKDYCRENNLDLTILNLSAMESADFCGRPYVKDNVTHFACPSFLTQKEGIIFIDEVTCISDNDVKTALKSLLLDREINGHKLSEKVLVICAGNPQTEDYDTYDIDKALKDRLLIVPFSRTLEESLEYLASKYSNNLMKFFRTQKAALSEFSPRTLEASLKFFDFSNDVETLEYYLTYEVKSLFVEFLAKNVVSLDEVLRGKAVKLEAIATQKIIFDAIAFIQDNKLNKDQCKNLNNFIKESEAESKAVFFMELKKLASKKDSKDFSAMIENLKEGGFFVGLTKFLKEIL